MSDTAVPRFGSVAIDCPDPMALADFYGRLLEWVPDGGASDEWVTLTPPAGGIAIGFQRSAGYRPPTWPAPDVQQMLHLDLEVDDMDAAHERAIGLGARLLDTNEGFHVYADPVGHPFCLCAA